MGLIRIFQIRRFAELLKCLAFIRLLILIKGRVQLYLQVPIT